MGSSLQPLPPDKVYVDEKSPACTSVLNIPPNGKQRCGGARSTCSGGQWDREVPPSRVSIRAFLTNLVPQALYAHCSLYGSTSSSAAPVATVCCGLMRGLMRVEL
jgi:hypothetical protein